MRLTPRLAANVLLVLTLGWALASFFLLDGLSFYPAGLAEQPLVWWRDASSLVVVSLFGGIAVACVAEPLMKRSAAPQRVFGWLLACVLALIVVGQLMQMFGGVAVYTDRIERRDPSPWGRGESLRLTDVTRVEVGCVYGSRGRLRPSYRIVFADGRDVYLENGLTGPMSRDRWLDAAIAIDDRVRARGAVREIGADVFGHPNESARCVSEFAEGFGESSDAARRLLQPLPY